ncbi:hypothetical protein GCM10009560_70410 [Nonomuraea longicatena]|uniref:Uncharacterized protein n=1 Tax=Nonomuraea longicatena TaxID=83682 RepID=A0ABP4BJB0_9ACTN
MVNGSPAQGPAWDTWDKAHGAMSLKRALFALVHNVEGQQGRQGQV